MGTVIESFIKRSAVIFAVVASFMGLVAAYDQIHMKYASAKEVRTNSHDIGGLIILQKMAIEESRRQMVRERLEKVERKMARIEEQFKKMPPEIRRRYNELKRQRRELENQLK
jgi:predicted nuclease with TOPRIM domain